MIRINIQLYIMISLYNKCSRLLALGKHCVQTLVHKSHKWPANVEYSELSTFVRPRYVCNKGSRRNNFIVKAEQPELHGKVTVTPRTL